MFLAGTGFYLELYFNCNWVLHVFFLPYICYTDTPPIGIDVKYDIFSHIYICEKLDTYGNRAAHQYYMPVTVTRGMELG